MNALSTLISAFTGLLNSKFFFIFILFFSILFIGILIPLAYYYEIERDKYIENRIISLKTERVCDVLVLFQTKKFFLGKVVLYLNHNIFQSNEDIAISEIIAFMKKNNYNDISILSLPSKNLVGIIGWYEFPKKETTDIVQSLIKEIYEKNFLFYLMSIFKNKSFSS